MDLGADQWQTFRHVTFPAIRTALLAGGLLAFALSFDEVIVTTFTTGGGERTIPIWILQNYTRTQGLPIVNAVALHPHPASRSSRSTSPSAWPARRRPSSSPGSGRTGDSCHESEGVALAVIEERHPFLSAVVVAMDEMRLALELDPGVLQAPLRRPDVPDLEVEDRSRRRSASSFLCR